jgi:hypothetical protein
MSAARRAFDDSERTSSIQVNAGGRNHRHGNVPSPTFGAGYLCAHVLPELHGPMRESPLGILAANISMLRG